MTAGQIRGGILANVIFFGIVALAVITNGWFMVALVIAVVVALLFLIGSGAAA